MELWMDRNTGPKVVLLFTGVPKLYVTAVYEQPGSAIINIVTTIIDVCQTML
jgi:hypothetical protein